MTFLGMPTLLKTVQWTGYIERLDRLGDKHLTWEIPYEALPKLQNGERLKLQVNLDRHPWNLTLGVKELTPSRPTGYFWLGQHATGAQ